MILNAQERDFKARIWTNLNKQWLIDQKEKKRTKKAEQKTRKALKATNSVASSSQVVSEPQSPRSEQQINTTSPDQFAKRLSSAVSNVSKLTGLPAKKRNIKADSAADALK